MSLKILQTSDTHLGITSRKAITRMLKEALKEDFDIIVHCGDYCGGMVGHRSLGQTVKLIREFFPDKPFISVIGNHDFWEKGAKKKVDWDSFEFPTGNPSLLKFTKNYEKIVQIFKDNKVHFLDEDGLYIPENHPEIIICGTSGWYQHPNPGTNDGKYLPVGLEGHTNGYLLRRAERILGDQIDKIQDFYDPEREKIVFVSHFPVVKVENDNDYKGSFEQFCWSENISNFMIEQFNCRYFLNGHAHSSHKGPLRWECGSNYYLPKFQIIEISTNS